MKMYVSFLSVILDFEKDPIFHEIQEVIQNVHGHVFQTKHFPHLPD